MPATWRDRMAVGTTLSDTARICSPKPSSIFSQTTSVASGVTSRFAGPVPPVAPEGEGAGAVETEEKVADPVYPEFATRTGMTVTV